MKRLARTLLVLAAVLTFGGMLGVPAANAHPENCPGPWVDASASLTAEAAEADRNQDGSVCVMQHNNGTQSFKDNHSHA